MWRLLPVLVLVFASCGGESGERTLEEWLVDEVPDVEDEQVDCVAAELRSGQGEETLEEWTELDVSSWSEEDYLEHPDVSEALASAGFGCVGEDLGS